MRRAFHRVLAALAVVAMITASAETVAADRIVIIDGDTVAIGRERIRLLDVDAPETSEPRCEAELVRGLEAKQRVRELVGGASHIELQRSGEQDRYGRTLGRLLVDGEDLGAILLREGKSAALDT